MSLINQTCWVVGGVGVVGRGITRGLLKSGATVIVNSRNTERLARLSEELEHPERLITVHGSLLPGRASQTIEEALDARPLNHVVAHGAVRYWTTKRAGCDETYSLQVGPGGLFQYNAEDFGSVSSQLASLHYSAAQELIPRLQFSDGPSSYTFVTGDGGGHPSTKRSAIGEINSHHAWGLAAALRGEQLDGDVNCREIRVELQVNRSDEEREEAPRDRPLSEDIGDLCAGLAATTMKDDKGALLRVTDQERLEELLVEYNAAEDKTLGPMPQVWELAGSL